MTDNLELKKGIEKTKDRMIAAIEEMKKKNGVHPVNTLADTLGLHFSKLLTELEENKAAKHPDVVIQIRILAVAISLLQDTNITGIKDLN